MNCFLFTMRSRSNETWHEFQRIWWSFSECWFRHASDTFLLSVQLINTFARTEHVFVRSVKYYNEMQKLWFAQHSLKTGVVDNFCMVWFVASLWEQSCVYRQTDEYARLFTKLDSGTTNDALTLDAVTLQFNQRARFTCVWRKLYFSKFDSFPGDWITSRIFGAINLY